MTFLLDTNVCIRYLNGRSESVRTYLESTDPSEVILCSIVKAELFYGVMKSNNSAKNLVKLQHFVSPFASVPFDDSAAEIYGNIRTQLERAGTPIGPNDLQIAAIALANELTLVTHNTREFSRVSNLRIEDWEV